MMQISEPVTVLTDYALVAASVYFAARLHQVRSPRNRTSVRLWSIGYLASGLAAFTGGTFHGFALILGPSTLRALWNVTVFAIGASGAFMVSGVFASSIREIDESRSWLLRGVSLTFAGFVIQQTGFRRGSDFNHNDIFHLVQIIAFYLFFRGARLLQDRHGR